MTPTALILTLRMDPASAAHYTRLRRAHFPPERNWLDAHITLFHALPLTALDEVQRDLRACAATTPAFTLQVERVRFLGGGVAYDLAAAEALALRRTLAAQWAGLLGRQDSQWRGPLHVTVQNKVRPEAARALHAELARSFVPHTVQATGLDLWYYLGGPWRAVGGWPFRSLGAAEDAVQAR